MAVFFGPNMREQAAGIRTKWPAIEKKRRKTQIGYKYLKTLVVAITGNVPKSAAHCIKNQQSGI